MKKLIFLILLTLPFFISCTKRFPDGPKLSFRTIATRIAGNWELENYLVNGIDSAGIINSILGAKGNFFFTKATSKEEFDYPPYSIQWGNNKSNYFLEKGTYNLGSNSKAVFIEFHEPDPKGANMNPGNVYIALGDTLNTEMQILKCKYKTMWLGFSISNRNYELHLNRKN